MNMHHTEVLSALLDSEPVDPDAVSLALDDPDARAAFVDFIRLREAARRDADTLPASLHQRRRDEPVGRVVLQWAAAAAVLVLVFIAGLLTPLGGRGSDDAEPPRPARVEKFEPGVDWHQGN